MENRVQIGQGKAFVYPDCIGRSLRRLEDQDGFEMMIMMNEISWGGLL